MNNRANENITVKLDNGIEIRGKKGEVFDILSSSGHHEGYYFSESKQEFISISEMDDRHIKNAILKMYRNWLDMLKTIEDPNDFFIALCMGISMDITFSALVREYEKRFSDLIFVNNLNCRVTNSSSN